MRKVDQISNDECFPCCLAMVLDRPRRTIPYHKPSPGGDDPFWHDWLTAEGIEYSIFHPAPGRRFLIEERLDRLWIAIAPGAGGLKHAVVMQGAKLFHDPYRWSPRKRRPTKIFYGAILNAS